MYEVVIVIYQYQLVLHTFLILPPDFERGAAVQGVTGVFHGGPPWDVLGGKLLTRAACNGMQGFDGRCRRRCGPSLPSYTHTNLFVAVG